MKFYPQAINAASINAAFASATLSSQNFTTASTGWIGWSSRAILRSTADATVALRNFSETISSELAVEANDVLAFRRGTNAQNVKVYNTFTDASNYERLAVFWGSNIAQIAVENAGTGSQRDLRIGNTTFLTFENGSGTAAITRTPTSSATIFRVETTGGITSTAINFARLLPIINQASGTYTVLDLNPTETAIGAGPHYLLRGRIGAGNNVFSFDRTGALTLGDVAGNGVMLKNNGGVEMGLWRADGTTPAMFRALMFRTTGGALSSLGTAGGSGAGSFGYVTDLTSTTRGATAAGGGSLKGFVWSDGTNWIVF